MIQYNMKITGLITEDVDGKSGVVTKALWELSATQDGKTATFNGTTIVGAPGDNFVAFDKLQPEEVLAWVDAIDDIDPHKLSLAQQLGVPAQTDSIQTPPWAN